MKLVLAHVSSAREPWADAASELYLKKISAFFPMSEEALKPKKAAREDAVLKRQTDSETLLASLKPDDYVILFDEKGKTFDSVAFSKTMEQALSSSKKRIVFLIGGAYGVNENVKTRAQKVVSLSPLTFNHLLAKTVALEQIYRALTILRGLPYHNV